MTARARLVETPITAATSRGDSELVDLPSVEDHLMDIRRALALATVFTAGAGLLHAQDHAFEEHLEEEARAGVEHACEQAWQQARELAEALPSRIHNMRVVVDEKGGTR